MNMDKLVPEAGNLAGFIEQFPLFASAPGGVLQLREFILSLAVRGLLIPCEMVVINSKVLNEEFNILKLPKGWGTQIISEVVNKDKWSIKRGPFGSAIKKSFFVASGYKVYEQQNAIYDDFTRGNYYISEEKFIELQAFEVKPNDLIVSCSGTVGKVAEAPSNMEAGIINQALLKISLDQKLLINDYFKLLFQAYFMNTPELQNLKGTAQKNMVSVKTLKSLPFPYPPLEEQKRIVAKVDELMALCDKLEAQQQQQANTVLRANTAAINALLNPEPQHTAKNQKISASVSVNEAKASFVQNWQRIDQHFNTLYGCILPMPDGEGRKKKHLVGLENVKALREAIFELAMLGNLTKQYETDGNVDELISNLVISGEKLRKKKNIRNVKKIKLPEEFKTDKNIPDNWRWTTLDTICYQITDGAHHTPTYTADGVHFLSVKDLTGGGINFDNTRFISEETHSELIKRCCPEKGDMLFTKVGTTGIPRAINIDNPFSIFVSVALLKFSNDYLDLQFFEYLLGSPLVKKQSSDGTQGVGNKNLVLKTIRGFHVPIPPLEEQKRIVAKVDQLMLLCDQVEQLLTQSYNDAEKLMHATVKALVA